MARPKSRRRPAPRAQPQPAPSAPAAPTSSDRWGRREWFLSAGLAAAVLLTYSPVFRSGFCNLDDPVYVTQNPHVLGGLSWANFRWAWTATVASNWHPLTMLSLQLDGQLFGRQALGYHLTNLALHLVNTLLLFVLLRRMTGAVWRSAVVTALFGVHPLHVESVAWVSERKDVLSSLFGLLALLAYAHYARRPAVGWYAVVFGCLALSLLAKPMLVTLPALLLLLDYWPLRRWGHASGDAASAGESSLRPVSARWLLLEKVPLLLLVGACCAWTVWAQRTAVRPLDLMPVEQRLGNALASYAAYLRQMAVPLDLAPYYPHPGANLSWGALAQGALVLVGVTTLVLLWGRRWGYLPVGWFWYLGMLVPVIGLVQVGDQARADRYTYLPLVGVFLMLTWGLTDLARRWHQERAAGVLAGVVLAVLLGLGWTQVSYWQSNARLWQHALDVTDESLRQARGAFLIHNQLAGGLLERGDLQGARTHFEEAVKLDDKQSNLQANLGLIYYNLGKPDLGLPHLQRALGMELNPGPPLYFNLALVLNAQAQAEQAAARTLTAQGQNDQAAARSRKAADYIEQAVARCQDALNLDPDIAAAYSLLGSLYLAREKWPEAVKARRQDEADRAARRALDRAAGQPRLQEEIREQLRLYQERKPLPAPQP
jgi:tetratricopeptide (TPR) repeat protein